MSFQSLKQSIWNLLYLSLPFAARRTLGLFYPKTRPDFIIIGTQRGGTTSLFNYLNVHPQIHLPIIKEIHYFDLQSKKTSNWYFAHFPMRYPKSKFITGEASPYYLFHPDVAMRVAQLLPEIRLIVLLREPVARAYSHYRHSLELGLEHRSFETAAIEEMDLIQSGTPISSDNIDLHRHQTFIARGLYIEQLENWLNHIPRENILILLSERFFQYPHDTFNEILAFLDVEEIELPDNFFITYNRGDVNPVMAEDLRRLLRNFYEPFNQQLATQFGLDLEFWQEE